MEATISKAEYEAAMAEKDGQIAMLRHELDQLKRLIFASKSERFVPAFQPEQMALWDDSPERGAAPEETEKITYERTKKKRIPAARSYLNTCLSGDRSSNRRRTPVGWCELAKKSRAR